MRDKSPSRSSRALGRAVCGSGRVNGNTEITPDGPTQAPNGLGVLYWAPEHDLWNADGSPAPAVFTLDNLTTLATGPASHAPPDATP